MPTPVDARRFWDLYFRNAFLTLERHTSKYVGQFYAEPELAAPPGGLLRDMTAEAVEITFDAVREYDCSGDGRFALFGERPLDIGEAYEAVIRQTYPYRDRAPFGKQRMAELFSQIRVQCGLESAAALSLAILEQVVISSVENHTEALNQPLAALAWFLGERRERSSSAALLTIIHSAPFAPYARHHIHFTAIDTAFSALWKVNDKAALWDLIDLLRGSSNAGRRKIAPLFERLLSTRELLSLVRCEDDYFKADFWARMLTQSGNYTPVDWDRFDAYSLFWELRNLAALRLPQGEIKTLRILAQDEVETVRDAARDRIAQSSP
jgi:hypothetical protein